MKRATDRLDNVRHLEIARAGWENDRALRDELGSYEATNWDAGYYAAHPEIDVPRHLDSWQNEIARYRALWTVSNEVAITEEIIRLSRDVTPGLARPDKPIYADDGMLGMNIGNWGSAASFVITMEDGTPTLGENNLKFAAWAWNYALGAIAGKIATKN